MNRLSTRLRAAGVCAGIFAAASFAKAQAGFPLSLDFPSPAPAPSDPAPSINPAPVPPADHPAVHPTPLSLAPDSATPATTQPDSPSVLEACACGCGIYQVGTSSMFPQGQGGTIYLEYDYQNQTRNWHGNSRAPAADNDDKDIRTHFLTAGLQYMFNQSWGFQLEVPYDLRHFVTVGGASGNDLASLNWGALGDIRIQGLYTGFFPDLSAGITFGVKLPTGSFRHNDAYGDIDRDSELGTGSTDILLGGFYRHPLTPDNSWTWFAQLNADLPVLIQDSYRPGIEIDGALGIYYSGFSIGQLNIVPVGQILASERTSDCGANAAHPVASGFQRLFLSPGIEFKYKAFSIYTDLEVPVYQYMNGDQLTAPAQLKLIFSYNF